ncbi:MAG: hypothetical protein R2818_05775 [Flavobacteriales bacterium]
MLFSRDDSIDRASVSFQLRSFSRALRRRGQPEFHAMAPATFLLGGHQLGCEHACKHLSLAATVSSVKLTSSSSTVPLRALPAHTRVDSSGITFPVSRRLPVPPPVPATMVCTFASFGVVVEWMVWGPFPFSLDATGMRSMPQAGQDPGSFMRIRGCMEQVQITPFLAMSLMGIWMFPRGATAEEGPTEQEPNDEGDADDECRAVTRPKQGLRSAEFEEAPFEELCIDGHHHGAECHEDGTDGGA